MHSLECQSLDVESLQNLLLIYNRLLVLLVKDKTAFITGAAKGIGRATAVALSASGCHVILTDIDQEALAKTKANIEASGGKTTTYLLDVSNRDQVNAVHQQPLKTIKIDYFINNAGIGGKLMPLHLTPLEEWQK